MLNFFNYKVRIKHLNNEIENIQKRKEFELFLEEKSILYKKTMYFPEYYVYNLIKLSSVKIEEVKKEYDLEFVDVMPKYFLKFQTTELENPSAQIIEEMSEKIIKEKRSKNEDYFSVGIIDNGISPIPKLVPWLIGNRNEKYPDKEINPTHGTFVAGIIIYGDLLEEEEYVISDGIKIFNGAVIPNFDLLHLEEDQMMQNIREVIESNLSVKIWNLSLSIRTETKLDKISDFAKMIDWLQQKHNILICKSAGNSGKFVKGLPPGGLLQGSDTVMSLVVGSVDKDMEPSQFSRSGEGFKEFIKPDVVAFGGYQSRKKEIKDRTGTFSLNKFGEISHSVGTSFATARMTALSGTLAFLLKKFSPLFIKGLIIHSANHTKEEDRENISEERLGLLGFGFPKNSKQIVEKIKDYNIIEKELNGREKIEVKIPKKNKKTKITLVSSPVLDFFQEDKYVNSDIRLSISNSDNSILKPPSNIKYREFSPVKKYELNTSLSEAVLEIESYFHEKFSEKEIENIKQKFIIILE